MTDTPDSGAVFSGGASRVIPGLVMRGRCGQFLTVILTPELVAVPPGPEACDNRLYEPLGTVVVFQLHTHP